MKFTTFSSFVLLVSCLFWLSSCNGEGGTIGSGGSKYQKTEFGHEYMIHNRTGDQPPQGGDYVYFDAYIRKADGTVAFSSRDQGARPMMPIKGRDIASGPIKNPVEDVIRLIGAGDSTTIRIFFDSLDFKRPAGFETEPMMYYDMVIRDIKRKGRRAEVSSLVEKAAKEYQEGKLTGEIKETASGLKYIVLEEGQGRNAQAGDYVMVSYYGTLTNGTRFDDSMSKNRPFGFPLGNGTVISGWDEGLTLMNEGSKYLFFIPPSLAYGEQGSPPNVPGNAELIFYIDLEIITKPNY